MMRLISALIPFYQNCIYWNLQFTVKNMAKCICEDCLHDDDECPCGTTPCSCRLCTIVRPGLGITYHSVGSTYGLCKACKKFSVLQSDIKLDTGMCDVCINKPWYLNVANCIPVFPIFGVYCSVSYQHVFQMAQCKSRTVAIVGKKKKTTTLPSMLTIVKWVWYFCRS